MINLEKIQKRNIRKAIVFYQDPDTHQYRMVTFGMIEELMDMFWSITKMWFQRVKRLIKDSYGKELSKDEWTNLMAGTMPIWMTKHTHEAMKKGGFNLDYWIKEEKD